MKIADTYIIGCGAVGSAIGARICKLGAVYFYGREGNRAHNFSLQSDHQVKKFEFPQRLTDPTAPGLVILAIKAYELESAVEMHLPKFMPESRVLVLSNGYLENIIGKLVNKFPQMWWYRGVCLFGVAQPEPLRFQIHTKHPIIKYGPVKSEEDGVSLHPAELFERSENIMRDIQLKWFANTVVNTLCAAYKLPRNGDVLNYEIELEKLSKESYALLSEIYTFSPDFSFDEAQRYLIRIIQTTMANENSMSSDLRKTILTEKEFLSGLAETRSGYPFLKALNRQILAHEVKAKLE